MDEVELFKIVARQKAICDEIQRLRTNISKDGPDRKTAEYKSKRLQIIESLWEEFHLNHEKVLPSIKKDTPYMMSNTYEKVSAICKELRQTLRVTRPEEAGAIPETADPAPSNAPYKFADPFGEVPTKPIPITGYNPGDAPSAGLHLEKTSSIISCIKKQSSMITMIKTNLKTLVEDRAIHTQDFYTIRLKSIEQHWAAIQGLHYKIWDKLEEPQQSVYDTDYYFTTENEVHEALTILYERSRAGSTTAPYPNLSSKLPKVVLPKFDGDYAKWAQFRDLYTELVHNQPIPQCQKMWYLKTTLTGEAERLIKHFGSSDANYNSAWETITNRYENK